jgi:hypothetical protein
MTCMTMLIIAACSATPKKEPLSYSYDAETLIIYGDHNSWPGGPVPGQECNRIPNFRIWGDGRIVYSDINNGNRIVYTGKISQEKLQNILEMLDERGFFFDSPPNSVNPAGTAYKLIVNLENKQYQSFWSDKTEIYSDLINAIKQENLEKYTPHQGLLIIGPYKGIPAIGSFQKWPEDFPFSLSEVGREGKWITDDIVLYVWEIINNQPEPLTGIEENGNIYSLGLEIKNISIKDPPYDCWNR